MGHHVSIAMRLTPCHSEGSYSRTRETLFNLMKMNSKIQKNHKEPIVIVQLFTLSTLSPFHVYASLPCQCRSVSVPPNPDDPRLGKPMAREKTA